MLELDSANLDNQVLVVLFSGKETFVVWTYSKKALVGTAESTEAAEEPMKLFDRVYAPEFIQAGHYSMWFVC